MTTFIYALFAVAGTTAAVRVLALAWDIHRRRVTARRRLNESGYQMWLELPDTTHDDGADRIHAAIQHSTRTQPWRHP